MDHDTGQQRRTAQRRAALVIELLRGVCSVAEAAQKHNLTVAEIETWRERFLSGAELALCNRRVDDDARKDREIRHLQQQVDKLALDLSMFKEAVNGQPSWR